MFFLKKGKTHTDFVWKSCSALAGLDSTRCFPEMEEDAKTERLALCCVALSPHFQSCAVSEGVSLALRSSFLAGCDPSELRVLVPVLARPPPARGAGQGSAAPGLRLGAFLPLSSGSPPNPSPQGAARADGLAVACERCASLFRCFSFAGTVLGKGRGALVPALGLGRC